MSAAKHSMKRPNVGNRLALRLLVHTLCLCVVVDLGCAARAQKAESDKKLFITPEHTAVRLKEKCSYSNGLPGKDCRYLVRIDAVEVER